MKHILLHPAAQAEWQHSAAFYAERSRSLAADFNEKVWEGIREAASHPLWFPLLGLKVSARKCPVARFPFLVVYIDQPEQVEILAIAHAHRELGYWQHRLNGQ